MITYTSMLILLQEALSLPFYVRAFLGKPDGTQRHTEIQNPEEYKQMD